MMRTEAAVGLEIVECGGSYVTHAGFQAADELVGERAERTFIRDAAFDAFRHGFPALAVGVVLHGGVAVGAGVHCGGGAHAAVGLEGAALIENCFAGGILLCRRREAADHHHAGCACGDAFVTSPENLMPPSAMMGTPVPSASAGCFHNGGELRDASAGDDARGADRAGADADFEPVDAE